MEYTKGKWEVYTGHDDQFKDEPLILAPRGDRQPGTVITKLVDCGTAETTANAQLIAASPRLFEYIKGRADEGDNDAKCLLAVLGLELITALSKAEGR